MFSWKLTCLVSLHPIVVTSKPVLYSDDLVGKHLQACCIEVFRHHSRTSQRAIPYLKGNQLVTTNQDLTWWLHVKMGSLQVFGLRVGFITAGKAGNTTGQDITKNQQGGYTNRQGGKWVGHASYISPTHGCWLWDLCP